MFSARIKLIIKNKFKQQLEITQIFLKFLLNLAVLLNNKTFHPRKYKFILPLQLKTQIMTFQTHWIKCTLVYGQQSYSTNKLACVRHNGHPLFGCDYGQ